MNSRIGTWPLMRRLATEFVRPHFGKLMLAFLAMGVVAGATAANAWMMQPLMDKVFVERNETLLLVIPARGHRAGPGQGLCRLCAIGAG